MQTTPQNGPISIDASTGDEAEAALAVADLPLSMPKARALFYAHQAVHHASGNFIALNELASCQYQFDQSAAAHASFSQSLAHQRNQQKAHFFLANIAHDKAEYAKAEKLLTQAIDMENWETTPVPTRKADLFYNRACAYGRLSIQPGISEDDRKRYLDAALHDIRQANFNRTPFSRNLYKEDILPGGDLFPLMAVYADALKQL